MESAQPTNVTVRTLIPRNPPLVKSSAGRTPMADGKEDLATFESRAKRHELFSKQIEEYRPKEKVYTTVRSQQPLKQSKNI